MWCFAKQKKKERHACVRAKYVPSTCLMYATYTSQQINNTPYACAHMHVGFASYINLAVCQLCADCVYLCACVCSTWMLIPASSSFPRSFLSSWCFLVSSPSGWCSIFIPPEMTHPSPTHQTLLFLVPYDACSQDAIAAVAVWMDMWMRVCQELREKYRLMCIVH